MPDFTLDPRDTVPTEYAIRAACLALGYPLTQHGLRPWRWQEMAPAAIEQAHTEAVDTFVHEAPLVQRLMGMLAEAGIRSSRRRCRVTSYALKHMAEAYLMEYVPNGTFILAAHLQGFRVIPCSPSSPNAFFNMQQSDLNALADVAHQRRGDAAMGVTFSRWGFV